MKIFDRHLSEVGNRKIADQIRSEIYAAINGIETREGKFVVNDTIWYWRNPEGNVKPTVVNSAKFITSRFQSNLEVHNGWSPEKKILGQDVDAYKEFQAKFKLFVLEESKFVELLQAYEKETGVSSGPIASSIYRRYCKGGSPTLGEELSAFESFFDVNSSKGYLRVAVEFETGNIASSFRAANKLEFLYSEGKIDLGIFITSNDKPNCAARIWPVSNRNGSFQELEKRGFGASLSVPLWQIGFAPDEFDGNAPYLSETGSTYELVPQNQNITIGNNSYEVWRDLKGQDRFKRIG
ncbi:hypothetical protein ABFZ85_06635 [Hyphococcus formosus]|uniref:hypothetical protein n=1 Tax=Hyphococcus formosus TaxID=3143534 RepID=UPI00398B9812